MSLDLRVSSQGAAFKGHNLPCAVGRSGIGEKLAEGDGITPIGIFALREVWFRADRGAPVTNLPMREISPHDGWSDDVRDPFYNQHVILPHALSHESLWRDDAAYDLLAVMDYNLSPIVAGAGSAVFLHIWRGADQPTEGCVALSREDLLFVLAGWTAASRIIIQP